MDIKEIVLKVAFEEGSMRQIRHKGIDGIEYHFETDDELVAFAEALVAEIQRRGDPVAWEWVEPEKGMCISHSEPPEYEVYQVKPLFTFPPSIESEQSVKVPTTEDEAALMVLLGTNWLESNAPHRLNNNIEALEDKVAEACAAVCDEQKDECGTDTDYWHGAKWCAEAIRSGEWKKFRKGE